MRRQNWERFSFGGWLQQAGERLHRNKLATAREPIKQAGYKYATTAIRHHLTYEIRSAHTFEANLSLIATEVPPSGSCNGNDIPLLHA
ncbi:MAG: hypothetical protein KTR19_02595 [Hyphomicrobiales bacterium]|nr:hypothetical protein [Hyphomicrobiales bacterium]